VYLRQSLAQGLREAYAWSRAGTGVTPGAELTFGLGVVVPTLAFVADRSRAYRATSHSRTPAISAWKYLGATWAQKRCREEQIGWERRGRATESARLK